MEEGVALKRKEEEQLEEERKRKKKQKEEEKTPEMAPKKAEIESGKEKGMAFGEAKPLVDVQYVKVPLKEVEKAVKYEPVVREELAVRLQEEEKKKEELQKQREEQQEKEKMKEQEIVNAEKPKIQIQRETEAQRVQREAIRRERKEQYQKLHKELDDAVKKGMSNPLEHIAQNLLKQELARGAKKPIGNVIRTLRLAGLLQKKKVSEMKEFLKNLIPKMA